VTKAARRDMLHIVSHRPGATAAFDKPKARIMGRLSLRPGQRPHAACRKDVDMNHRDMMHRLTGLVFMAGAGASTLVHRQVWQAHASGPASAMEAILGLLTFFLASLGLLLTINGCRLHDGWKHDCERAVQQRERQAALRDVNTTGTRAGVGRSRLPQGPVSMKTPDARGR
jgi:hypothetical protein